MKNLKNQKNFTDLLILQFYGNIYKLHNQFGYRATSIIRFVCHNTFKSLDFSLRKYSFKTQINADLKENLETFLEKFTKFDIKYSAFFRKK